jgi:hypothetical protein
VKDYFLLVIPTVADCHRSRPHHPQACPLQYGRSGRRLDFNPAANRI